MTDVLATFERVFVLRGERLWEFSREAAFHVVKAPVTMHGEDPPSRMAPAV
jgi:hypothetical protein